MNLLHVLAERGYSGGEVQLEHLLAHLQARGHENCILLPRGARFASVARALGVEVLEAPLRSPWHPGLWLGVRAAVRHRSPDIVHFGCGRSLLWAGLAARRLSVPLRVTTRRIDYPIGAGRRGRRYRDLVDHVVANCESVRQRVLAAGVPPARVTLVHEGIDLEPWQGILEQRTAARTALAIDPAAFVVTCAASLRPRKGQHVLVAAFARLAAAVPGAVLFLAGEGSDLESLRARAQALGVSGRVRLPGAVRPVQQLYAASDVFCMPSFHEGLSNACLEASAAGLPLVVTAVGGLPEIVEHAVTGTVVAPGDADALARALLGMHDDAEWRARAGRAGATRTARMFTHTRMAEGMEALFLRLLAERLGAA
ncbi:MAG: glycosyltransferase family 4 protein [Planctomycetota bacterium]